jgi:aspartate/methionine/tyrosine aminotransferase
MWARDGAGRGIPELREALVAKLEQENGITGREVMVTAGANQAFVNAVLATCDPVGSTPRAVAPPRAWP